MENFFNDHILRFVESCNNYNVRMLLVGGVAVNYYGYKRHSADIDFWIDPRPENMKRMLNAFKAMGYKIEKWPREVMDQKQNISVKLSPGLELELLTNFNPGVSFDEAYKKSVIVNKRSQQTIQWNVIAFDECSLKSLLTPKSPKGDFFKLLIFSSSPLGVRGKNGKNQQFEGFLYCTL